MLLGDVHGSVSAIMDAIASYKSSQCHLGLLDVGVGPVTPGDLELARLASG